VQEPGIQDAQGVVEVVGHVQARPRTQRGGIGAEQRGEGGAVDDDLAAPVRVARAAGREGGDQRSAGGGVGAVPDEPDTARRQQRLGGHGGGALGEMAGHGHLGVAGDVAVQLDHRRGQFQRVVVLAVAAGDEAAAAVQPHHRGGGRDRRGQRPRHEAAAGQVDAVIVGGRRRGGVVVGFGRGCGPGAGRGGRRGGGRAGGRCRRRGGCWERTRHGSRRRRGCRWRRDGWFDDAVRVLGRRHARRRSGRGRPGLARIGIGFWLCRWRRRRRCWRRAFRGVGVGG